MDMKWISVKDRLPENEDVVLIYAGDEYQDVAMFSNSDFYEFDWEHDGWEHESEVTHWMPLPVPPEKI